MAYLHVSLLDITLTSAGAFRMVLQGNRPVKPSLCMNQMWHVRSASAQRCKSSWITTPLAADCVHLWWGVWDSRPAVVAGAIRVAGAVHLESPEPTTCQGVGYDSGRQSLHLLLSSVGVFGALHLCMKVTPHTRACSALAQCMRHTCTCRNRRLHDDGTIP